jgi:hypothetical protein
VQQRPVAAKNRPFAQGVSGRAGEHDARRRSPPAPTGRTPLRVLVRIGLHIIRVQIGHRLGDRAEPRYAAAAAIRNRCLSFLPAHQ